MPGGTLLILCACVVKPLPSSQVMLIGATPELKSIVAETLPELGVQLPVPDTVNANGFEGGGNTVTSCEPGGLE